MWRSKGFLGESPFARKLTRKPRFLGKTPLLLQCYAFHWSESVPRCQGGPFRDGFRTPRSLGAGVCK
jgi:hypothetical protein